MKLSQRQAQRIFESDLEEVLASNVPFHSSYFSIKTILDDLVNPPRSIRCRPALPEKYPTWVWLFAEANAFNCDNGVGYLIGRAEKWPSTHLEYGIASNRLNQREVIIEVMGLSLLQAYDWD